jgi:hypothetical protein
MKKTSANAVTRTEEVSAICDDLMLNPPDSIDDLSSAKRQLTEHIAELELLQAALLEKQRERKAKFPDD